MLERLTSRLRSARSAAEPASRSLAGSECAAQKRGVAGVQAGAVRRPRRCYDPVWQRTVLTQPVAIKAVADFCQARSAALKLFDAGDVQANGFQIVEDDAPFDTITESGASYMGFAVSRPAGRRAAADKPRYAIAFTGDGSFMMNPQVLIDGGRARRRAA